MRLALEPGGGLLGADVAFPVLHGPYGEDGTVQGLLELLDVPYVGAGVLASSLCMDKVVFKDVLAAAGVPQVGYVAIREARWRERPGRGPRRARRARAARCSSSPRGWARRSASPRCATADELAAALEGAFAHDGLVIVEAFSAGVEVECAVMGLNGAEASVPGEVVLLGGAEWYDYEAKYSDGGVRLQVPARIPDEAAATVRRLARGDVPARRLRGPGARRLLRRGRRARAGQRAQHAAGDDADVGLPQAVGGERRAVAAGRRPAARDRARAPRRRAAARALTRSDFGAESVSCVIATWSSSGGSLVIQTR